MFRIIYVSEYLNISRTKANRQLTTFFARNPYNSLQKHHTGDAALDTLMFPQNWE